VTNDNNTDSDEREVQVEALVHDLAEMISAAPAGERERLRDMAVHLLRDEIEISAPVETPPSPNATVNPFAIGIPLILAGGVMLILFPPVGLLLFAAAGVMMVWGVATVLLVRRAP
jgi:hypothetical protein